MPVGTSPSAMPVNRASLLFNIIVVVPVRVIARQFDIDVVQDRLRAPDIRLPGIVHEDPLFASCVCRVSGRDHHVPSVADPMPGKGERPEQADVTTGTSWRQLGLKSGPRQSRV